ncbi:MAG TPA: hypothetical protein VEY50_01090 [Lysobacter sp.]|nr:hypothetical protein [Lysobacter sp.]
MIYPTAYDVLPMGFAEAPTQGALIDGQGTCGVQAQRDPNGDWHDVQVVVAMAWDDSASGQSRLAAYGRTR